MIGRYVSSAAIIQLAGLTNWVQCMQKDEVINNEKNRKQRRLFPKKQHRHGNPVTSFECARVTKSIIDVTMH